MSRLKGAVIAALVLGSGLFVGSARAGAAGWYAQAHFYTGYIKFTGQFVAPSSWGNCDQYGFCDFPSADVTLRILKWNGYGYVSWRSYRDETFIGDDTSITTWDRYLYSYELGCNGRKNNFKWIATLVNPVGGANESSSGYFWSKCGY